MAVKALAHRRNPNERLSAPPPLGRDGASSHPGKGLVTIGAPVPSVRLAALESEFDLAAHSSGWLLVWCFPGDDDEPFSIDEVMGRSFEEHRLELVALDCGLVGVSSQGRDTLGRLASRAKTTYPLLSDPRLSLAGCLSLPTIQCGEERLYRWLVFIAYRGRVTRVFYRVRPWDCAAEATRWLTGQSRNESRL